MDAAQLRLRLWPQLFLGGGNQHPVCVGHRAFDSNGDRLSAGLNAEEEFCGKRPGQDFSYAAHGDSHHGVRRGHAVFIRDVRLSERDFIPVERDAHPHRLDGQPPSQPVCGGGGGLLEGHAHGGDAVFIRSGIHSAGAVRGGGCGRRGQVRLLPLHYYSPVKGHGDHDGADQAGGPAANLRAAQGPFRRDHPVFGYHVLRGVFIWKQRILGGGFHGAFGVDPGHCHGLYVCL